MMDGRVAGVLLVCFISLARWLHGVYTVGLRREDADAGSVNIASQLGIVGRPDSRKSTLILVKMEKTVC